MLTTVSQKLSKRARDSSTCLQEMWMESWMQNMSKTDQEMAERLGRLESETKHGKLRCATPPPHKKLLPPIKSYYQE